MNFNLIFFFEFYCKFFTLNFIKYFSQLEKKEAENNDSNSHLSKYRNSNNIEGVEVRTLSKKRVFKFLGGTKDGKKEGFGVEKWNNNSKYTGFYKNDLFEGYGKYRRKTGERIEGKLTKK